MPSPTSPPIPSGNMNKDRIEKLLTALEQGLVERKSTLRLAFLAAMAGESMFLLGPPGVAKSLIARRLKYAFKEGKAFEYLMNKFSTPDEIFGPVSIQKLKEDKYERQTAHYLPGATVVFLDEIWKAGPSIQNTLLTVINEKVYRNGAQEEKLPLKALIAASNELPAEGEGLEALWDRFLIRELVEGIQGRDGFEQMICATQNVYDDSVETKDKLDGKTLEEFKKAIPGIKVGKEILDFIQICRKQIEFFNQTQSEKDPKFKPIYVSDRRWKKMLRLLKTSAMLNGREQVDMVDCYLIKYCIWDRAEQINFAHEMITENMEKHSFSFTVDMRNVKNALGRLKAEVTNEVRIHFNDEKGKQRTLHKKPIHYAIQAWDQKVENLTKKIREKEQAFKEFKRRQEELSKTNLFVPPTIFGYLEKNLVSALNDIQNTEVELSKIQHVYKDLKKTELS